MLFLPAKIDVEKREDGTLVLRSPVPGGTIERCIGDYLERWAAQTPNAIFLAQREGPSPGASRRPLPEGEGWRSINYATTRQRVRAIASSLLRRNPSCDQPLAILSDNSIEHALLSLAAMHIGIPAVPLSPAYSLLSKDFAKLRAIFDLIKPGIVFVDDAARFAPALDAVSSHNFDIITCRNGDATGRSAIPFESLLGREDSSAVDRAFAAIGPATVGKLLLTSGSTGHPKAVINTQRMMCYCQTALAQVWPIMKAE